MTDAALSARISKFKRRVGNISSQAHLDRVMASFPVEHREAVCGELAAEVPLGLKLRSEIGEPMKLNVSANPSPTEETVQRLNQMQQVNTELREQLLASEQEKATLAKQVAQLSQDLANALTPQKKV